MARKPWPIIILATFFFCIPIMNIVFNFFFLGVDTTFINYLESLISIQENYIKLFNMIIPAVISSISIYCVKKWSYPVILCCLLWLGVTAFLEFTVRESVSFSLIVVTLPMIFNLIIVSYFLIPSVKTTYYEPRVRWWEAKPRYLFERKSDFSINGKKITGKITNISEGGIFFEADEQIETDATGIITFTHNNEEYSAQSKIIFKVPNKFAYGMQFDGVSKDSCKKIKLLIKGLKDSDTELCRPIPLWDEDLKKWFFDLLKTKQGFTPNLPPQFKK